MKRLLRPLLIGCAIFLVLGIAGAGLFWAGESRLTSLVESESFRQEMNRQTSKGLHFQGEFAPIRRTGVWSGRSDSFSAGAGIKAMRSLEARNIEASFNPLGILQRRWQLDQVIIQSGKVEIQTYEPQPPPAQSKPWYAIFLPDRVYLKEVICEKADIVWPMRGRESGFFGARLVVTPFGRDFDYAATGGVFRMRPLPELELRSLSMRITRPELTLFGLELAPPGGNGRLRVTGRAGLQEDRRVNAQADFENLPLAPWLPAEWRAGHRGQASGEIEWQSPDLRLESSTASGRLRLTRARLEGLRMLDFLASAARDESLKSLAIDSCHFQFKWKYPRLEIENLVIGSEGVFQLRGQLRIRDSALDGTLELGVAPRHLEWIPKARAEVFQREEGGYCWTPVKVGGTLAEPQTDLAPRLEKVLRDSPGVAAGLFFRTAGEWLEQLFQRRD